VRWGISQRGRGITRGRRHGGRGNEGQRDVGWRGTLDKVTCVYGDFEDGVYIGWVWSTCSRSISSIESLWFDGKRLDCIN